MSKKGYYGNTKGFAAHSVYHPHAGAKPRGKLKQKQLKNGFLLLVEINGENPDEAYRFKRIMTRPTYDSLDRVVIFATPDIKLETASDMLHLMLLYIPDLADLEGAALSLRQSANIVIEGMNRMIAQKYLEYMPSQLSSLRETLLESRLIDGSEVVHAPSPKLNPIVYNKFDQEE